MIGLPDATRGRCPTRASLTIGHGAAHELASILAIADRCIMLDRAAYHDAGGMIAEGDPRMLRDTSTHPIVRAFFRREVVAAAVT